MADKEVKQHDIIQITEPTHHWYPCLLIVDELKSWGVMAYCLVPQEGGVGQAWIRLNFSEFEVVGMAHIAREAKDES